jgi:hypothetical protein
VSGFETAIPVGQGYRVFRLQALGAKGQVLGRSPAFRSTKENAEGAGH